MFDIRLSYENLPWSLHKMIRIMVISEQPNKNALYETAECLLEGNIFKFMPESHVDVVLLNIQSQINLCIKEIISRKKDVELCNSCKNELNFDPPFCCEITAARSAYLFATK